MPRPPERQLTDRLSSLRGYRTKPPSDLTLVGALDAALARARANLRHAGELDIMWLERIPRNLAERSRPLRLDRGTLVVGVSDAPTHYALHRFLRAGGEEDIVRSARRSIRRIRIVLVPPTSEPG